MGRRAHAVHCTWRVAQNVQTSLLVHGKKIRLDFLDSAYITDDTLNQNYRRALPNSKNSDSPNISIGAHTLLWCEIAETSHDAGSNGNFDERRTSSEVKNWISPRNFLKSSVLRVLPPKISSTFVDRSKKKRLKVCQYWNRSLLHHDRQERSAWQKKHLSPSWASKCSSRASVGYCRRFHWRAAQVFIWWSLFRWQAVWFEANIDAVDAHASAHWFKQSEQWNIDWSTCWSMHANIVWQSESQWVHCSCAWQRPQNIWSYRVQRSTGDLLDARPVTSHDHDDRPRICHWPHTQTLDYHCRHSMAIPGDVYGHRQRSPALERLHPFQAHPHAQH